MCRLVASALGVLIGCTDVSTSVDTMPSVHASRADGHRAILDAFGAKDEAYVVSEGELPAVHVGADGTIDLVYTGEDQGAACQHPCRFAEAGLTVHLAPFADTATGEYRVEVAQDRDFADAIADAFFVK